MGGERRKKEGEGRGKGGRGLRRGPLRILAGGPRMSSYATDCADLFCKHIFCELVGYI